MLYVGSVAAGKARDAYQSHVSTGTVEGAVSTDNDIPDLFTLARQHPVNEDALPEETITSVPFVVYGDIPLCICNTDPARDPKYISFFSRPPPEVI
jgi:hypothetical protein